MIHSLYHFDVFRTEFVDQRKKLFAERLDRVAIVLTPLRHLLKEAPLITP